VFYTAIIVDLENKILSALHHRNRLGISVKLPYLVVHFLLIVCLISLQLRPLNGLFFYENVQATSQKPLWISVKRHHNHFNFFFFDKKLITVIVLTKNTQKWLSLKADGF
jgi:hypothetical protein